MPFNGQTISAATLGAFTSGVFTDTFSVGFTEADMVALDLVAGTTYEFDVDNGAAGDLFLRIFDQFGTEVRANDDGFFADDNVNFSLSPYLRFTPNFSGRYHVAISPWYLDSYDPEVTTGRASGENPLSSTAGTLTVTNFGAARWASAGMINGLLAESINDLTDMLTDEDRSLRLELTGLIDSLADVDIARIDLVKGDVIVVDVNGVLSSTVTGTVLRVFNAAGTQIGFDDDGGVGEDPQMIINTPVAGAYFIGVSGEGNSTYNGLDGTGTVAAVATGGFEIIIHRNPTQVGSASSNSVTGNGRDNYIVLLSGNDTATGGEGDDTIAGGDDQDIIDGNNGDDVLYGEHGNDLVRGLNGRDMVSGGLGNDTLDGGTGNDILAGGAGNDSLLGGGGNDTLRGDEGDDTLNGTSGDDLVLGGAGNDSLLAGTGNDTLNGEDGDDILRGQEGLNLIDGGAGNDMVFGGTLADDLTGGIGNDSLQGFGGNDTLAGGDGIDTLTGSGGADVFEFVSTDGGLDRITDFTLAGAEAIDLRAIFGAGVVNAGNLAQFVQTSVSGISDSFLAVDANGVTGGLSFIIIAQMDGITSTQLFDVTNFLL